MKIKFLSLLLIITAIIMISGCVDEAAQGFNCKAPDLCRTIFFPYTGLLDHEGSEMQGAQPHEFIPDRPNPSPESMHTLRNATSLLDNNIEKAENISLQLGTGIARYKAEGKDVSRLEALLKEYNRLIEEAKRYRAFANVAAGEENSSSIENLSLSNGSSEDVEKDYLIQSQKSMMQANRVLRDIFEELHSLMPGNEELNSTSRLTSAGRGKAILMGSFLLNLHLEGGKMAVVDPSGDSEININGDYTFEEKNDKHDKVRLYYINSADVKISGSRKTVFLDSENVTLTSEGEGYVAFQGNGTYSIEESGKIVKEESWAKPFFDEGMRESGPDRKDNNTEYGPNRKNDIQNPDFERKAMTQ